LPADGVLAGAGLAGKLHVAAGDTITIGADRGGVRVRLAGLLDEPVGTNVYASEAVAARVLADSATTTSLLRFTAGADRDAMRARITRLPGVLAYVDAHALTRSVDQYLGLFWVFIGVMIILGAVLAFAVIYVTMAVNVVERTNELATLRTAGTPLRRVAGALATENLLATALGVPFGLLLGTLAARAFLASFSNDLFHLDLHLGWWPMPAAAGVLLAAALSQWPATRAVRRMDIARVVRERAT
jgi:putative ABC transport system permease protein